MPKLENKHYDVKASVIKVAGAFFVESPANKCQ